MFGFKKLLAIAAVVCAVVAHENHTSCTGVTVTVTVTNTARVTDCGPPGSPPPTGPIESAPTLSQTPGSSSTKAPLSSTSGAAPPVSPPVGSSLPPAPAPSGSQSQSVPASKPAVTPTPSNNGTMPRPSPSTPLQISTNRAAMATPLASLGGLVVAMAAFV